ncbi:putative phage abortive infection protein [Methanosarcina sp. Kolksee]|uniref:putative phage abortive infection protein n=1 Tax=Methanosarcina sp. Kolksee TaxID=1434099 RepID=UPI0012E0C1E0
MRRSLSTWESSDKEKNRKKFLNTLRSYMSQKELTLLISELTFRETVSTFITKPKIMKHMELLTFRGQISA